MDAEQVGDVDLKHYAGLMWQWLWFILLILAFAAGGAYLASSYATPIYEASTMLLISEGEPAGGPDYGSVLMNQQMAGTYSLMLTDASVLDEVIARLGLTVSERQLAKMITSESIRDTLLISLRVRGPDPDLAAKIANLVPQVFIEQYREAASARYASSTMSLDREMEQLQTQIQSTQAELDAERARYRPDAAELARLEILVAQYRSAYEDLARSHEELRVAEVRGSNVLTITRPARVPTQPVLPRKGLNTILAAVAGAASAVGAALIFDYADDTVKSGGDVQKAAGLPTLTTVFRIGRAESGKGVPLMIARPDSVVAEAYRWLRTNLQSATSGMGRAAAMIVVSSAGHQEGKTTVVANLGVSLAQIGKQVLLVDADLRHPTLHDCFGLQNEAGLTSLLLHQEPDPERIVRQTGVKGLRVLTSGPIAASAAELLEIPHLEPIIARLGGLADFMIVDSPPVLSVADASILAQKADGVLLVAQFGKTRRQALREAVLALQKVKAHLLGVVLNKASSSGR